MRLWHPLCLWLALISPAAIAQPQVNSETPPAQAAPPAPAPSATPDGPASDDAALLGSPSLQKAKKIGRVHDNLRRAKARHSLFLETKELYGDYSRFKDQIDKEIGLTWSIDLSYLPQWGWFKGGSPSAQFLTTPNIDWRVLSGKAFGEGSVQVSYITARYPSVQNAGEVSSNLGMITPINDFPFYQNIFAQLTYTQAFPGNKLLVTVGQYPFYNFDGNQYLANQQENFNSYILSQNGSATYPNAGLGAYAQLNLTSTVQVAAGLQNAADIPGDTLTTRDFGKGGYAWFTYAQWTPQFHGLGPAQYSFMYYQVPTVSSQSYSSGWSFNGVQNLNSTWAVFARANSAADYVTPIRQSFALGAAMNNPLGRNPQDQIGLAMGYSFAASPPTNPAKARDEKVLETYWNWNFLGGFLLTPSVQWVLNPSLSPDRNSDWVLSLRATLML